MIKIKIFCSFAPSDKCKEVFEKINYSSELNFYGKDKKYYLTNEDDYTHAIIMNTAMPNLNIPKENVLGLAFEPICFLGLTPPFIEYAKKHIGTYFVGEKPDYLPDLFKEHFGYMWHMTPLTRPPVKKNIISLMIGDLLLSEGHKYRHILCNRILQSDLPIDIYGKGCTFYSSSKDPRIKGVFKNTFYFSRKRTISHFK